MFPQSLCQHWLQFPSGSTRCAVEFSLLVEDATFSARNQQHMNKDSTPRNRTYPTGFNNHNPGFNHHNPQGLTIHWHWFNSHNPWFSNHNSIGRCKLAPHFVMVFRRVLSKALFPVHGWLQAYTTWQWINITYLTIFHHICLIIFNIIQLYLTILHHIQPHFTLYNHI